MPSPVEITIFVGVAVAVTDRPGTDAVADRAVHTARSTQIHVGRCTSCRAGGAGFSRTVGAGTRNRLTA
ncbi:MAG: hypothetical protein ACRDT6_25250 [Micromonosporaceae bacterium]